MLQVPFDVCRFLYPVTCMNYNFVFYQVEIEFFQLTSQGDVLTLF